MHILVLHNYYGSSSPSGENIVVDQEIKELQRQGHIVKKVALYSDTVRSKGYITRALAGLSYIFSLSSYRKVSSVIKLFKPDVIYIHNVFPLLSPSVFWAARNYAIVYTLHNYRLICPRALPYRDGGICTKCIDSGNLLNAVKYKCYNDSYAQTIIMITSGYLHKWIGTYKKVNKFVFLSNFQKNLFKQQLKSDKRSCVKYNMPPNTISPSPDKQKNKHFLFVGRLSNEKGVDLLLNAWQKSELKDWHLNIVGDGPQKKLLQNLVDSNCENISFLGSLHHEAVLKQIRSAECIVIPSRWFEGFPLVLAEAISMGCPVILTKLGPLYEIGKKIDATFFEYENVNSLKDALEDVSKIDSRRIAQIKDLSNNFYLNELEKEKNIQILFYY